MADNEAVAQISSLLEPEGRVRGMPHRLRENGGFAFIGCNMNGTGFEISPEHAQRMLRKQPRSEQVLAPLLGGEEINRSPDLLAPKWVIDFYGLELADARQFIEPLAWVEERVRPHRMGLVKKPKLQRRWWRFERDAIALRSAISSLSEVLAIAITSKSLMPVRVSSGNLFTHSVCVFATDSYSSQAVLSSAAHQMWVIKYGSGLRSDPRYTPSDVFETFPRPEGTSWLDKVGRDLDLGRREIMVRREIGLTKLYNQVNDPTVQDGADPDVAWLREIHVELDEAVMDAYGWSSVQLNHGFHAYRQMERWTICPAARVEILDRLLAENHRRAAIEAEQTPPSRRAKKAPEGMGELFS